VISDDELRSRIFMESVGDAFFAHDLEGRFMDVNQRACEVLGYTRDELLGMTIPDVDPNFDLSAAKAFWNTLEPGAPTVLSTTHRRKDGTEFPVEVQATLADLGEKTLIFGMARDMTQRVNEQAHLQRMSNLYNALSQCNQAIVRVASEEELFPAICRIAVEFGAMRLAWIGIYDPEGRIVECAAAFGEGIEYLDGLKFDINPDSAEWGPTATAILTEKAYWSQDFLSDPKTRRWHERAKAFGWRSSASLPIFRGGKVIGAFGLYSSELNAFAEAEQNLLLEMAMDIGAALDRFELERSRVRAEEIIQEQNEFLQTVLENQPDCVKVVGKDGHLLNMNKAGLDMLQVDTLEEAQEIGLNNFLMPEHVQPFRQLHHDVLQGHTRMLEFRIKGKRGDFRWLKTHAAPLRDASGKPIALLGVTRDITSEKLSEEVIWRQANYDSLTGLPNRQMFRDHMESEIRKAERTGLPIALLLIDLDHFKEVNDSLGHEKGDALLVEAAQRISDCVRKSDVVSRIGGDEFAVILPEIRDLMSVTRVSESIIQALAPFFQLGDDKGFVTASVGITFFPNDGKSMEGLLRNADQAMYQAKREGRGRFSFFTPQMQENVQKRVTLTNEMRDALQQNQFLLHYQPIVNLMTGEVHKAEALIRWNHPRLGTVSPGDFIPLAEENGLIVEIGYWVLQQGALQVRKWRSEHNANFQISLNKSPAQFRDSHGSRQNWPDLLHQQGLPGQSIVVEITEGLLLNADKVVKAKLEAFRDAGLQVAIDDFGTGYSSLAYLKRFDIDYLKIDRTFVSNLEEDASNVALCKAIIMMAHELGLQVIAEGVENDAQKQVLIRAGCDYAQGFLFSKPLPSEEFEQRFFIH
jgi:diguanylate cyclase (GGDEF)-like protein/PAS domain S-box-containing protein